MKVEKDMIVSVHYTGKLTENGEEFDTSIGKDPLTFIVGKGQMIPGFEQELMGAVKGDKKTFELEPERAYGEHDPEGVQKVPKDQFPPDIQVGMVLAAEMENGQQIPLKVVEITDEEVTIDFNHMLAGKGLTFEVEIMDVNEQPKKECNDDGCC
ncbi:MAG: FKBP-type peptidyl-prolyl cis-trans isomerase SlyD [Methanobacteriota archaeon]|nr:MAG: FKBP-type peptidyl-prolyl cis-trans isomerase SlyD [Euryarchaeota archaeon]